MGFSRTLVRTLYSRDIAASAGLKATAGAISAAKDRLKTWETAGRKTVHATWAIEDIRKAKRTLESEVGAVKAALTDAISDSKVRSGQTVTIQDTISIPALGDNVRFRAIVYAKREVVATSRITDGNIETCLVVKPVFEKAERLRTGLVVLNAINDIGAIGLVTGVLVFGLPLYLALAPLFIHRIFSNMLEHVGRAVNSLLENRGDLIRAEKMIKNFDRLQNHILQALESAERLLLRNSR